MGRIQNIILRARDTLADPDGERWSDDRLIRLIDEAQKDICRRAKLLRTKIPISVYNGIQIIYLPDDLLLLDRVVYNGKRVPLIGHSELDETVPGWETEEGTLTNIVYDKLNRGILKFYPIPNDVSEGGVFEFTDTSYLEDISYQFNSDYGISVEVPEYTFENSLALEDINYEFSNDYGILTEGQSGDTLDSDYGIATDITTVSYSECGCNPLNSYISGEYGVISDMVSLDKEVKVLESPYGVITESGDFIVLDDYGVLSNAYTADVETLTRDSGYGVVSSLEGYDLSSDYGILTEISDEDFDLDIYNVDFGVTVGFSTTDATLDVYYIKKPNTITSIDDSIEIDNIFDVAIKYYVTGKALRDDMDTQNRTVGNEELAFYDRELIEAIKDDYRDFTRSDNNQYKIRYNGGFNG
jgi:hypothetical protein